MSGAKTWSAQRLRFLLGRPATVVRGARGHTRCTRRRATRVHTPSHTTPRPRHGLAIHERPEAHEYTHIFENI
eukprot:scaffold1784_cov125-Isochrysis_galbana.AAC.2